MNDYNSIIYEGLENLNLNGNKVLMIIPDTTRTAPVGQLVKLIYSAISGKIRKMDILIALGTHKPLSRPEILKHLKMTEDEYDSDYRNIGLFNHTWDRPLTLCNLGTLSSDFIYEITDGLLCENVDITINRMINDYDHILILGPVFPHEVAGFSGGSKYLFPGISGPKIIDFFHWLGALMTNVRTIGQPENPVRTVLNSAAQLMPIPVSAVSIVVHNGKLAGCYVGPMLQSWRQAVQKSKELHIVKKTRRFETVLACAPLMYDDLWTGGKCMYKCEPVVANGGELIIYAPHISSLSYTHGKILETIGYHIRDYYLSDMKKFADVPRAVMAVSTYLKGQGTMDGNMEKPRIRVSLATSISSDVCRKVGLGYHDPSQIEFSEFQNREDEGVLFVERAGETLFLPERQVR